MKNGNDKEVKWRVINPSFAFSGLKVIYSIIKLTRVRYGIKGETDQVIEYYYGNRNLLASHEIEKTHYYHWGWNHLRDINCYHQDDLGSVVMLTNKLASIRG